MTLQDDDVLEREQDDAAEPAERSRTVIDAAAGTVTDGAETYSINGIPDNIRAHLALVGLQRTLKLARDPALTLSRLRAGQLPSRGRGKKAEKELPPWQLAYAHAKVEATKKTEAPMSLDDAKQLAAQLPRETLKEIKTHPLVVKHYARLTGSGSDLV